MTNLTKEEVRTLRMELNAAIQAVVEKHNMTFEIGTIRFDSTSMRAKLECTKKSKIGELVNNMFATSITETTIMNPNLMVGRVYQKKRTTYTVTAFNPNRPKFCYKVVTNNGKTWLCPSTFFNDAVRIK